MIKVQKGRRMILAVAAVLAAAPLRSARAKRQVREDQGRTGSRGQVGLPGGASSLIWARNETEFAQALQDGAAERFVPMFDPRVPPSL